MAKSKSSGSPPPVVPKIFASVAEIDGATKKLRRRLAEVNALDPAVHRWDGVEKKSAESQFVSTILEVFGSQSPEYERHRYHRIERGPTYVSMPDNKYQDNFVAGLPHTRSTIETLIKGLDEKREDLAPAADSTPTLAHGALPPGGTVNANMSSSAHYTLPKGRIFIGHGHSLVWRVLKDYLRDELGLKYEEFDREPQAGNSTTERLQQMLDSTDFAFLIMTAEDDHGDGTQHARVNVIHEVGLFQGRHGFKRAIILLEDGCQKFSNIHGLIYISFPKGKIEACFEQVRQVLKRESQLG